MGYEFYVRAVTIGDLTGRQLPVTIELENRGVAPFYFDWRVEYGLIQFGKVIRTYKGSGKLTGLLPGDAGRTWGDTLDLTGVSPGNYVLALRVANPLPRGKPLRFANKSQDADVAGWLSLGPLRSP